MLFVRLASVFAALLLASATVLAQGAKLTDPQIAHIAYTAGQLDIEAAQQALQSVSARPRLGRHDRTVDNRERCAQS